MLNSNDIKFMEQSVRDIISDWNTTLTIMTPLPIDQQPNYDQLMHEYNGDIQYTTLHVPAERKDLVNNQTNDISPDIKLGDKVDSTILYAIPNVIPVYTGNIITGTMPYKPTIDDIFIIDDSSDRYHISAMRDRIGETLVLIHKYVGGTPNGIGTVEEAG